MASPDDAVIRLRLDTTQAEADLRRFTGTAGSMTVGGRGGGMSVPGIGPGGGGGVLGALRGIGPLGLGGGAAAGLLAAPFLSDIGGGIAGYAGGFGRNLSEASGLGAFSRNSRVREKAEDRVVSILGAAGKFATDAQIQGLYGLQKSLVGLETDSENRIRKLIGGAESKDAMDRVADTLDAILKFLTGFSVKSVAESTASSIVSGMSSLGRSLGGR